MAINHTLSELFVSSPIKPLQKHISKALECSEALEGLLQAAFDGDWDKVKKAKNNIIKLEKKADKIKRDIRLHLPKGWFMAADRRDLLSLLTSQDKIADCAEDIAQIIFIRQMQFPESLQSEIMAFLVRAIDSVRVADKAINELDELVTAGFKGRERKVVESLLKELDKIENETDEMQEAILIKLREFENQLQGPEMMFTYRAIGLIAKLADNAERVADRLELVVAH